MLAILTDWTVWLSLSLSLSAGIYIYFYHNENSQKNAVNIRKRNTNPHNTLKEMRKEIDFSKQALFASIDSTRNQPVNKLPVSVDLPRLARKTTVWRDEKIIVDAPENADIDDNSRIQIVYDIWVELGKLLNDECEPVKNYLADYLQPGDISVNLANFIQEYYPEESTVIRIFKVCNQSILASAVIRMKEFIGTKYPYKDQRGKWNIDIVIEDNKITVTHCKFETSWESTESYVQQHFSFSWTLRMEFDLELEKMLDVSVKICSMDFLPSVPLETRREIIAHFSACETLEVPPELNYKL